MCITILRYCLVYIKIIGLNYFFSQLRTNSCDFEIIIKDTLSYTGFLTLLYFTIRASCMLVYFVIKKSFKSKI